MKTNHVDAGAKGNSAKMPQAGRPMVDWTVRLSITALLNPLTF
jgi:hypothetical protein